MLWEEERREEGRVLLLRTSDGRQLSIDSMVWLHDRLASVEGVPPVVVLVVDVVHAELQMISEMAAGGDPQAMLPIPRGIRSLERYSQPVIAAVAGQASAGGCELILGCDVRVVSPQARLGLYETAIGIIPGAGGTQRLPRLVGPGQAARMIYEASTISGQEAYEIGLAEIVASDPEAAALGFASRIAGHGHEVLAAAKRALRAAVEQPLREGLLTEGAEFVRVARDPGALKRLASWRLPAEDAT
jgi:enoyl-CoA hydratase/carnithine racemase